MHVWNSSTCHWTTQHFSSNTSSGEGKFNRVTLLGPSSPKEPVDCVRSINAEVLTPKVDLNCGSESLYVRPRQGRPRAWKPQRSPTSRAILAIIKPLSQPASL